MPLSNNLVIKHKTGLLNLAEEVSNASWGCKVKGVTRDTFFRYREFVDYGGVDALIEKSRRSPNIKNRVEEAVGLAVMDYAIEFPANGQHRTSNEMRNKGRWYWRLPNLVASLRESMVNEKYRP